MGLTFLLLSEMAWATIRRIAMKFDSDFHCLHGMNCNTEETSYRDHACTSQIGHYKRKIIITKLFSFSLFLLQITI